MKRPLIWAVVAGLALLVLGTVAFFAMFEQVPTTRHEPPKGEARHNPYLALERFMQKMQRPLTRNNDAKLLDQLPAQGGVLILDAKRKAHLTPARLARLLAWVEGGGYLIAAMESCDCDVLMTHFGIENLRDRQQAEGEDKEAQGRKNRKKMPETIPVKLPGSERALTLSYRYSNMVSGERPPLWAVEDEDFGANLLHYAHGKGQVTFLNLSRFNNTSIGKHDEAEFLWSLLQAYQPGTRGPVILMTRLHLPTLWEWLSGPALAALVAGLTLLLLALWRAVPRFGPLAPAPEPNRRQLREHLTAVGRYVWRAGGLAHWLQIARETFLNRLALRQPAIARLAPEQMTQALSQLTRRPPAMIASALFGNADSMHDFTLAMRTLRNLERSL